MNKKDALKLHKDGKIEIVKDKSMRKQVYNVSATMAFPYLNPDGKMSPTDFPKYNIAKELLKKQTVFPHIMNKMQVNELSWEKKSHWTFTEDTIHLMRQYTLLQEMQVNSIVGYYLSQHPETCHIPFEHVVRAFKEGDDDKGIIDSHLPGLIQIMTQLPNTRERWFSECLGLETMARDLGDMNFFLTLNMDLRSWPDCRQLLYELENGIGSIMPLDWFEKYTDAFTKTLHKHAAIMSIYLQRKAETFLDIFFTRICGIPNMKHHKQGDWSKQDRFNSSYWWGRVKFTEARGVTHYHCLAKLPYVLKTAVIADSKWASCTTRNEMWKHSIS